MLPNQDACAAVIRKVSLGFNTVLKPVNDGITMLGNAKINPKFQIKKFFAELARNCGNYNNL